LIPAGIDISSIGDRERATAMGVRRAVVKPTGRTSGAPIGGRGPGSARHLASLAAEGLLVAAISGGLFWLVWIYGNSLRHARYLDGWLLAGGMSVQLFFHIAIKTAGLSPKSAVRWRKLHVFLGYVLIAVFVAHSDFSLPDTCFEWALWAAFVAVALSGIFGVYLAWSLQARRRVDEGITYERIPARCAELAQEVHAAVARTDPAAAAIALPAPAYDAWIMDLYTVHLRSFFQGPRNFSAHLIGSRRPLGRLTDEIDNLSRFVDQRGREKLVAIRSLVIEKDHLDFARVYLWLSKGWLFVHVPASYALVVLMVLHVLVVYAFSSSGA
jgi:hypothetical protein